MSTESIPKPMKESKEGEAAGSRPMPPAVPAERPPVPVPEPERRAGPLARPAARGPRPSGRPPVPAWLADGFLIVLFLGLTFLLGAFPLKDTDFYWHLRTGDLIRQTGQVPRTDAFTFTRQGEPWIDLHWVYQVAISWVHEQGGIVALNLAKCGV